MVIFSRAVWWLALSVTVVLSVAGALYVSGVDAGTPVATCTKAPDLRYDCTKILSVGEHVELRTSPGVCHGDVSLSGTVSAGLYSAKVKITHNVNNCPWTSGDSTTISYRLGSTPTPTGDPVAVGGIAGLLQPADGGLEDGAPVAEGEDNSPAALVAALGAVVALGAGLALVVRRQAGAARRVRGR